MRSEELNEVAASDDCIRFARLIAQYTLDEQMRLFGEQFKQASESNERGKYGTGNQELLDALPQAFTIKDLQRLKGTSMGSSTIRMTIKRWVDNELVKKQDTHTWMKI